MSHETQPHRALIAMMIALLACVVVMSALGIGKMTGTLDPLVARRGVGAMLGLILAATGNVVPKLRLFQPATGAAHSDAIDRFAGWTFVACGLSFAAVFLFAPADKIMLASPLLVVAGFLVVLARWLMWKGTRPLHLSPRWTPGRRSLATMLVSVLLVCAIFFADAVWGDAVSRWMGVLFLYVLFSLRALLAIRLRTSSDA
jgi:hypothetical protein